MNEFIELTPEQATTLMYAHSCEMNRIRHEAEPWMSQALRDATRRDRYKAEAVASGVPEEQANRFVFGEEKR